MINKAIARITEEMMKLNDPVAQGIEEYLTGICTSVSVAEKLLDPGKTLNGAYSKVWDEAKRRKKGNCAYIPPEEVYAIVREYYGIEAGHTRPAKQQTKINAMDLL